MLFPANLSASSQRTEFNETQATIHQKPKDTATQKLKTRSGHLWKRNGPILRKVDK